MAQALEDMGIAGKQFLQEALTNTTDPLGAIEEFQQENSILLPSLQPALPLLDLHNLKRIDFHQSVFCVLRDSLLNRIAEICKNKEPDVKEKLLAILEKSFPLIKIESLAPVSMCLLQHLPKVPEKYITALTKDKQLYTLCPIEVKRQIWQKNQTLFGDEVLPLLTQYIKEKEILVLSAECSVTNNFFSAPPKSRRQSDVVRTLTEMIGKNIRLYDMVLQFLRTLFLKTHNVHYCSLRAEILMALHDLEITVVCSVDPCYKFTWCLDACIREHFVDLKRARELQGFLDSVQKGQEQVLGDLSMILCDPFAVNTLLWSMMKIIHEVAVKESLPRDSTELALLIRMLALGQSAWDIINKQVFKEPKVDGEVVRVFVPSLLALGHVDQLNQVRAKINNLNRKMAEDSDSSAPGCVEVASAKASSAKERRKGKGAKKTSSAPPEDPATDDDGSARLLTCISKHVGGDQVSRIIAMWHILYLIKHKKKGQLVMFIPAMSKCANDAIFTATLTAFLSSHCDLLADERLCQVLFKLLLPTKTTKDVHQRVVLRLLLNTCHRIPLAQLKPLVTKLEPKSKKASEQAVQLHRELHDKFASLEETARSDDDKKPAPDQLATI